MRKIAAPIVLLMILVGALSAPPAGATPPTRETMHDEFDVDFGADLCGFPLTAHVVQTVTLTTFFDAEGNVTRAQLTGPISVVFTNGNTGESVRLSIPGPTFFDADGNPVRGTGAWAVFTSEGGFVWAAGNIVFDEFGNAAEITGMSVSVCDLL